MVTAIDCAFLSDDVYNSHGNLALQKGWRRLDNQRWGDGFAAGVYEKEEQRVIAFRGTDDSSDVVADVRMMPDASARDIESVTPALLHQYGLNDRVELMVGSVLLSYLLTSPSISEAASIYANQAPPVQTRQAEAYMREHGEGVSYVTGHSLGGALAKIISLRKNLDCVAFNSPYMGNLRGVAPVSSSSIRSINAKSDPLSFSTRQVGNLPHGSDVLVTTDSYSLQPPRCPRVRSYQRPVSCPRVPDNWWASEEGIYAMMYSPFCEMFADGAKEVGRAVTYPVRNFQYWFNQRPEYIMTLFNYLSDVAGHYHSMTNLRTKMMELSQFNPELTSEP